MSSVPNGIRQRELFGYLGIPKPAEREDEAVVQGRSGVTWSLYRIHPKFVLECESSIQPWSGQDFDDGFLDYAVIRQGKTLPNGVTEYVDLKPYFDPHGVVEVHENKDPMPQNEPDPFAPDSTPIPMKSQAK